MLKALTAARIVVVDRNADAVKLAQTIGADEGIVAEGKQVDQVLELTGGVGAEVVVDFVGEGGATSEGVAMLRQAGDYYVVGYGENINVPTIDIVSSEINVIGNLVGSYNDLCDLMALAARGLVTLHTQKYALDDFQSAIDDLDNGRVRGRAILIALRSTLDLHHRQVPRQAGARRRMARVSQGSSPRRPEVRRGVCGSSGHAAWTTRTSTSSWRRSVTTTPAART